MTTVGEMVDPQLAAFKSDLFYCGFITRASAFHAECRGFESLRPLSLLTVRLRLTSLALCGLSAFAERSQRRGSANRDGDWDLAALGSNPFARFVKSLGDSGKYACFCRLFSFCI